MQIEIACKYFPRMSQISSLKLFRQLPNKSEEEIDEIISKVDHNKKGLIEYSEFLAHTLTDKQLSSKNLKLFFD